MQDKIVVRGSGIVYILDNKEVGEEEYRKRYPLPEAGDGNISVPSPSAWRHFYSDALAVHPKDVKKAEAEARAAGVPTEFEPVYGRPQFVSREHRKRYNHAFKYFDRNGGYGD